MTKTKIEWADEVWNPVVGCRKVSKGCSYCYAERMACRLAAMGKPEYLSVVEFGHWTGHVKCLPERLDEPLHWKKPRRVFVNSMSDLFHEDVPSDFIQKVFEVMREARQHTFLILTKRPERMSLETRIVSVCGGAALHPLDNVWLGISVEDQKTADERIPWLLKTPAALRFVSVEPMLGPVDVNIYLDQYLTINGRRELDWVICGGESGTYARPVHTDWVRSLRNQCIEADTPFFFKQWGEWIPRNQWILGGRNHADVPNLAYVNARPCGDDQTYKVGKKAAGNLLDGKIWDQYPEVK